MGKRREREDEIEKKGDYFLVVERKAPINGGTLSNGKSLLH